jgi:hypothetical protein
VGQSQNLTLSPSVTCEKTGLQTDVFGVFPKTIEKTTQKNGYWKSFAVLLTLYGKHLDDHWGFASLETGLRGEASGAKIDVGQISGPGGESVDNRGPRL